MGSTSDPLDFVITQFVRWLVWPLMWHKYWSLHIYNWISPERLNCSSSSTSSHPLDWRCETEIQREPKLLLLNGTVTAVEATAIEGDKAIHRWLAWSEKMEEEAREIRVDDDFEQKWKRALLVFIFLLWWEKGRWFKYSYAIFFLFSLESILAEIICHVFALLCLNLPSFDWWLLGCGFKFTSKRSHHHQIRVLCVLSGDQHLTYSPNN